MDYTVRESSVVEMFEVPLLALRPSTSQLLSCLLNGLKVIPTDEDIPRDWRGLLHLTGISSHALIKSDNPTMQVLGLWQKERSFLKHKPPSFGDLKELLGQLDRWDVVEDIAEMMDADLKEYLEVSLRISPRVEEIERDAESLILTRDDVSRIGCGLPAQNYDAFLLYADEDEDFAFQIINKLEGNFGLKLCVKERDLIGGYSFEHEAIMRLIAERCNRLIVVLTPHFLNSEANKFFVTYAQALGIEQRQRKVIPCLFQRCQIPSQLLHCFLLDYNRAGKLFDFWGKLTDSVRTSALPSLPRLRDCNVSDKHGPSRCSIKEISTEELSSPEHTALVCLSDPSTLYPPDKTTSNSDHWTPRKMESSSIHLSKPKFSTSFLRKLLPKNQTIENVKPKRKWFPRRKALALDSS